MPKKIDSLSLPKTADLHWSFHIQGQKNPYARWCIETPKLFDGELEGLPSPSKGDFEKALERISAYLRKNNFNPNSTSLHCGLYLQDAPRERHLSEFDRWAAEKGLSLSRVRFASSWEEHRENLRQISREIAEGLIFGQWPFCAQNGHPLSN